jgi:hypothetical protein
MLQAALAASMQQQPGQQQHQISDEDAELARVLEMSKNMK